MTAPSRGRDDATIRGAVVLVVAIVIGLALLWRSGAGDDDNASSADTDRETSESVFDGSTDSSGSDMPPISSTDPEATDDTQPRDLVTVIVFNGTPDRIAGIGREYTDRAEAAGFLVLGPADAATPTDTTTIYAAEGFDRDAEAVNEELGLNAIVAAKPAESLGEGDDMADVVVVLGGDYGGGAGAGTSETEPEADGG